MRRLLALIAMFSLFGCANAYKEYYLPYSAAAGMETNPRLIMNYGDPLVRNVPQNMVDQVLKDFSRKGYVVVGQSSFNSGNEDGSGLVKFAKGLHAHVVVTSSAYTGTRSGVIPVETPEVNTTYHSGVVGGSIFSGTSTTYGSSTSYIPYSVDRRDYIAYYMVKRRPGGLGIMDNTPNAEQRKMVGSNKGIAVLIVVEGSSAFRGDILEGDVITHIDGKPIYSTEEGGRLIESYYGKKGVPFTIVRNGEVITKIIDIDPRFI